MAHGAAHDPPQDIAAPFVRRHDAIGQQEAGRAQMVRDGAMAGLLIANRLCARELLRRVDQCPERIGVVIVRHALHDRRNPLKAHARINRRLGQWHVGAVVLPFKLHEHEVPDFDKTVTIFVGASGRATKDMVAMVVEYLAAWSAGSSVAHGPKIVRRGDTDYPFFRQAGNLAPQVERLIIGVINGGRQPCWVKPPFLGQQCPCMGNRLLFEIIAERKIAEHFKKRVMPRSIAHIIEVVMLAPCPHAFLA